MRKLITGAACICLSLMMTTVPVLAAESSDPGQNIGGISLILSTISETEAETTAEATTEAVTEAAPETTVVAPTSETVAPTDETTATDMAEGVGGISAAMKDYESNGEKGSALDDLKTFLENGATDELPSEFSNIAVSQVSNYVNVRSEPNSTSDIMGKVYNKCMATIVDTVENEEGTWYQINSGSIYGGYIKAEYFVTGEEAETLASDISKLVCRVSENGTRLRSEASTDSDIVTLLWDGEQYNVTEREGDFVKVYIDEITEGYIHKDLASVYIDFEEAITIEEEEEAIAEEKRKQEEAEAERLAAQEAEAAAANNSSSNSGSGSSGSGGSGGSSDSGSSAQAGSNASSGLRDSVVSYALQFVGNPYVWGGTSLTNGADCSGFVLAVFRDVAGIGLPHSSASQAGCGVGVSAADIRPGDIVYYGGHVAIYIGNGQIVHASDESTGIKVSSWTYSTPLAIRNVLGD